jgi:hypothetical protein
MKSRAAFEFTIRKMLLENRRLFFWTFTFRDVHSLKFAMGLWNQFLTIIKRKIQFKGVRVLELHNEHGCHFHVLTNRRFKIRTLLRLGERYGFGRISVQHVTDVAGGIAYLCKYLSKPRPPCLKRVRVWAAFGEIERTRVADIVTDSPFVRILRDVMGSASPDQLLSDGEQPGDVARRGKRSFIKALPIAWEKYLSDFDPEYARRQAMWADVRFHKQCELSSRWFDAHPALEAET